MSATTSLMSILRNIRGAAACASAVESGRRPRRADLVDAGIDPDAFSRIRRF